MNKIEVRKFNNTVTIQNERYIDMVNYFGEDLIPNIGIPYTYLIWSSLAWDRDYYVDANNNVQEFNDEQKVLIKKICMNWVQPLGQQGNPTIEQHKESVIFDARIKFNKDVDDLNTVSTNELISWQKQEVEARAYLIDNKVSTPLIDSIITSRDLNEDKIAFINRVIEKADKYNTGYGILLGKLQSYIKKVNLCTTVEEVNNVSSN